MGSINLHLPRNNWGVRTVSEYEKIECIGAGTYGQVYRAKSKRNGEIVALKKIRTLNETQGLPITTIREIKLLKHLQHKNLVRLIDIVTAGIDDDDDEDIQVEGTSRYLSGALYLVLEYVEHDLTGLLDRQHHFSDSEIRKIMKQLIDVMEFMHHNNYLHRDIKCSNLLLTNDHVIKLTDFGLARSLCTDQKLTNKVVTLWYRPPELLLGSQEYGAGSDMWSVGCVMAELFLGCPMFTGKNELEQINKIFDICGTPSKQDWPEFDQLPSSSTYVPKNPLPDHLESYLMKGMKSKNRTFPAGALELIVSLLQLNPANRISAKEASRSWYFNSGVGDEPLPSISELPPSHEYQTKQLRRDRAKLQQKRASAASASVGDDGDYSPESRKRSKTSAS